MSKLSALVPLIVTVLLLIVAAVVGFVAYTIVTSIREETNKKMQKRNITVSRDGMKVGVKDLNTESYVDRTQNVLVQVWNNASWPGYKSRLGWGQSKEQQTGSAAAKKKSPDGRPLPSSLSAAAAGGTEPRKPYVLLVLVSIAC